jgi:putative ABC transport system ATP-binding protein
MDSVALRTESLVKVYGSGSLLVKAVDDVSIQIERGEFVALVGPSGSGKTIMLAMIAGLLAPTSGQIIVQGQDLAQMNEARRAAFRRRYIGFAFQANNLVSYLSAVENVELLLRLNGELNAEGRKRARQLLERLGLGERLGNLPRQVSGGQQQRVAIARALINNPTLVLADEPTASLDTERAFQAVKTLANLVHEQNRACVMVTHDMRMVQFVDRVIRMVDGHLDRSYTSDQVSPAFPMRPTGESLLEEIAAEAVAAS